MAATWIIAASLQLLAHSLVMKSFVPDDFYIFLRRLLDIFRLGLLEDNEKSEIDEALSITFF